MQTPIKNYHLAVDIGASSGRLILGWLENGAVLLEEVHRFPNGPVKRGGHLCWDTQALFGHILQGLQACGARGKIPKTMGIDTWAVDYVLLDKNGERIGEAVCYRDSRTKDAVARLEKIVPFDRLYEKTGIQFQPFNTIYQLEALGKEHPEELEQAEHLLMLPEYFSYLLTGVCRNEYTNNTSTALVDARAKIWDGELLRGAGIPEKLFTPPVKPGTTLGNFTKEIRDQVDFDCTVVLPATHDTASAFLAAPAGEQSVILSSGTWSLLGVENQEPILTAEARALNFTNEGGYDYRYRFLKNIMGLWMIQSVRKELDREYSFGELEAAARESGDFPSIVDVNDDGFLAPESMTEAVKAHCRKTGQQEPQTVGELMQCLYQSLARSYAQAVKGLSQVTGRSFQELRVVGGGSRDGYLNELTAKATGLTVHAGPVEATALGNLLAQMIASGEVESLTEARELVKNMLKKERN